MTTEGMMDGLAITPLGAAIVEALPDRRKVARVKREHKAGLVRASRPFPTKESVEKFYAARGERIIGIQGGIK